MRRTLTRNRAVAVPILALAIACGEASAIPGQLAVRVDAQGAGRPNPFATSAASSDRVLRLFPGDDLVFTMTVSGLESRAAACSPPPAVLVSQLRPFVFRGLEPVAAAVAIRSPSRWDALVAERGVDVAIEPLPVGSVQPGDLAAVRFHVSGWDLWGPGAFQLVAILGPVGLDSCLAPAERVGGIASEALWVVAGPPTSPPEELGRAYWQARDAEREGDWVLACERAEWILARRPAAALALAILGHAKREQGDIPGAHAAYAEAVRVTEADLDQDNRMAREHPTERRNWLEAWRKAVAELEAK